MKNLTLKFNRIAAVLLTFSFLLPITKLTCQNNTIAAIELTKMNVLYMGVDNPIQVAVSGYKASDVTVSIDNGTIKRSKGLYIARVKRMGTANITVRCEGKIVRKATYRIKRVPDPVAKIGALSGGYINKPVLLSQPLIRAQLENFDFDMVFKVVGFTMTISINGMTAQYKSNSNRFTDEQKKAIQNLKIGQRVFFEDIKAMGPDGSIRTLNSIALKIR